MPNPINLNYYMMLIRLIILSKLIPEGKKITSRGQVLLEYGIILALVVMALIGMQVYLQRTLQARYKDAADKVVNELRQAKKDSQLPLQYEPYYQDSDIISENNSQVQESYLPNGISSTTILQDETLRRGVRRELPYSDEAGE